VKDTRNPSILNGLKAVSLLHMPPFYHVKSRG
jgi:hypothetical protein